jgi:hypothetical protein
MTTYRQFVKKTLKLTFYLIVGLTAVSFIPHYKPYLFITWSSLVLFFGLTLFSGYYNSRSVNKSFFLNIFFITLAIKFAAALTFFSAYFLLAHPIKYTVLPFMILFGIYKAFETIMLVRFHKDLEEQGEVE